MNTPPFHSAPGGYGRPPYPQYPPPRPPNRGARVLLIVLAAVVCVLFGSCAVVCVAVKTGEQHAKNAPEAKAKQQEKETSQRELIVRTVATLDGIHDRFPTALEERACEASIVPADSIPVITFAALALFRKGAGTAPESDSALRLTTTFLDGRQRPPANPSTKDVEEVTLSIVSPLRSVMRAPIIAVLKSLVASVPSVVPLTGRFLPGSYDGWLVLFDRTTSSPLCETRIRAASSASVDKALLARGNDAVRDDLAKNIAAAKEAARMALSPTLKLDW